MRIYMGIWVMTEKIQDVEKVKKVWDQFEKFKSLITALGYRITENSRHGKDWALIFLGEGRSKEDFQEDIETIMQIATSLRMPLIHYAIYPFELLSSAQA